MEGLLSTGPNPSSLECSGECDIHVPTFGSGLTVVRYLNKCLTRLPATSRFLRNPRSWVLGLDINILGCLCLCPLLVRDIHLSRTCPRDGQIFQV